MIYPMKKRIWINNERLDIWEHVNDEVTTPGQSTVLVNDGSDVIVRIFGHGSTMCMYAGGVAIDSFNGHLIILKRGTEANVTNIRPMDETMIDIDPYFTIISYTEPDVIGVCVENGVVKPPLNNPENTIVVSITMIAVPVISEFDVNNSDDLLYPIAWYDISRNCKDMCAKLGHADELPDHDVLMYTMFNEYLAPICVNRDTPSQIKLRRAFYNICDDVSIRSRMRTGTRTGIRKGSFVLMKSGVICQVTEEILVDDYLIKLKCLPDGILLKYYPYEFMEQLVAVLPDRLRVISSDWYAKSIITNGNPKEIITKPFDGIAIDKVADLRLMLITRISSSGELTTNDDKIVNNIRSLSQDLNLGKEIYVKLGHLLYKIRIFQNKSGDNVSIKEIN